MTDDAQMKIRLPGALKASIEEAANAANRSLNGEIVSRLEASFAIDEEARSRHVKQRILDIDLSAQGDGLRGRVAKLEQELDELRSQIGRVEKNLAAVSK